MSAPLNLLLDDLEDNQQLDDTDALYEAFTTWSSDNGRPLYPHQDEAFIELLSGNHVIAATPTGSGKTLIALAAHFLSLARGGRSYYTAPLKALVSEKFFELVTLFGPDNVGMATGDGSVNSDAPIICCTAEILANRSLRQGAQLDADMVVMDEFHFYGEEDRGWAWQVPLLELPQCQFVLLSATLGDVSFFQTDLRRRTGRHATLVDSAKRPVPLEMSYSLTPLSTVINELIEVEKFPIYVVHFSQRQAASTAHQLAQEIKIPTAHRQRLKTAISEYRFSKGFGHTLRNLILRGVGVHHAGMLPRYRRIVERLTQRGLLAAVCGTDTLGVGINVPITTVVFTALAKFDGHRQRILTAREFHQIAGRAGRAGFDEVGWVIVQAPPHTIENQVLRHKAGEDPKKLKKLTLKKLPNGEIGWSENTYERLINATPEPLKSQFSFRHSTVLNALAAPEPASAHLLRLARDNHDRDIESNRHLRLLGQIYDSLLAGGILVKLSSQEAEERGCDRLQLTGNLPDEFALNQPLSPFALAALDLLDRESANYALDVVSVIESILDDPRPVLYAQQNQARASANEELKAAGVDYGERKDLIEQITWPRPLAELLEHAFKVFSETNPWAVGHYPQPKSVVRFLVENAMTFTELISRFDLALAEGVLLRYLSDAYRALRQIIPDSARTDELTAIIEWLGQLINNVDSSLLAEWEALQNPQPSGWEPSDTDPVSPELAFGAAPDGTVALSANRHRFEVEVRREILARINRFALDDVSGLAKFGDSDGVEPWDERRWDHTLASYWDEYDWLGASAEAKSAARFTFTYRPDRADLLAAGVRPDLVERFETVLTSDQFGADLTTLVSYRMQDSEDDGEWRLLAVVDGPASATANRVVWYLLIVGVQ